MKNRTFPWRRPATRKRRGRTRLFVLGATFAASGTLAAQAPPPRHADRARPDMSTATAGEQSAPAPRLRFDIAAGPLEVVVAQFERDTGVRVTLSDVAIRMIQSPGVVGTLSPEEAISELLTGTSVQALFLERGAGVSLRFATVTEFVEVTGRAAAVSSPRYPSTLRDIPQTVALIPRTTIEQQGATTLSDALRNVPGITMQAGEGGGASNTSGDMFNMRGFNASNSLFVDGVRDDGLVSRDVFNLEQVEVFMGPTGSDVGRGTAAGYVNMQTKTPHSASATAVTFSAGSADRSRLAADFNWALTPTPNASWLRRSAIRLNTLWQDSGVPGRRFVENESRAVAPSIALGLGTPTRVIASAQVVRQENVPDYGIPGAAWRGERLTPTTVPASGEVDSRNYYGSSGYDYDHVEQTTVMARVDRDVSLHLTLRHQTRYNRTHREAVITAIPNVAAYDPATNRVTVARQGNERENSIVSNQTSAQVRFSTAVLRHSANLGIDYTTEEQHAPVLTGLGTRAPVDVFRPNALDPVTGFAPARTGAFSRGATSTVGFYAFDTVEIGSRWQATGGARWDRYETSFTAVDAAGTRTSDLAIRDGVLSGKAGLVFRASTRGNVYMSLGTSVTPPGSANFTLSAQANNQNNPSVKPQVSRNLEAGTKWDLAGDRLSLTGAVFSTTNENVIFTVDATAIPPVFNQDDEQRVNGVALGATGRITGRWTILASAGVLDTELRTQNGANNGNRLTLTPLLSTSIWSTYQLPRGLTLGGGIRQTGGVFVNAANTIKSPGYHLVDALAEYAVNTHLTLRLNVFNVTDVTYIRSVNNNGGRYLPGQPRSAMLTSHVTF